MIQQHGYSSKGGLTSLIAEDLLLALVLAGLVVVVPRGPLTMALAAAIPVVIAWRALTLHYPSRVEIDRTGIAFFAYGRVHRFAWSDIERISVRRFMVRDRVLVRIVPAPPFRGRYWLLDAIAGYDVLVRTLEQPRRTRAPRSAAI